MAQRITVVGPKNPLLAAKAGIVLDMDRYDAHMKREFVKRLMLICEFVKTRVQRNISVSSRAAGPSKEGEFPHAITSRLRNSIFWRVDEKTMTGIVGTPLFYGVWLEFGTAGGKVIEPVQAKALSWIDPATGERRFAKRVITRGMKPRSFLRRTLFESKPQIKMILNRPFMDMPKGQASLG